MEKSDKFLQENDKYAFLLGGALRNDDIAQFLEIYDKVLPQSLSEQEVEDIKARARWFSSLSEVEFTDISCQARQYSLAQPLPDTSDQDITESEQEISADPSDVDKTHSDFPYEAQQNSDTETLTDIPIYCDHTEIINSPSIGGEGDFLVQSETDVTSEERVDALGLVDSEGDDYPSSFSGKNATCVTYKPLKWSSITMNNSTKDELAKIESLRSGLGSVGKTSTGSKTEDVGNNSTAGRTPINTYSRHYSPTHTSTTRSSTSDYHSGTSSTYSQPSCTDFDLDSEDNERPGVLNYHIERSPSAKSGAKSCSGSSELTGNNPQGRILKHSDKYDGGQIIKHTKRYDSRDSDEEFAFDTYTSSQHSTVNRPQTITTTLHSSVHPSHCLSSTSVSSSHHSHTNTSSAAHSADSRKYPSGGSDSRKDPSGGSYSVVDIEVDDDVDEEQQPLLSGKRGFEQSMERSTRDTPIEMVQISELPDDSGKTRALKSNSQLAQFRREMRTKHEMMCDEVYEVGDDVIVDEDDVRMTSKRNVELSHGRRYGYIREYKEEESLRPRGTASQLHALRRETYKRHTQMGDESFAVEDESKVRGGGGGNGSSSEDYTTSGQVGDSDEEFSIHQALYGARNAKSVSASMQRDLDSEDYEDDVTYRGMTSSGQRSMSRHSTFNGRPGGFTRVKDPFSATTTGSSMQSNSSVYCRGQTDNSLKPSSYSSPLGFTSGSRNTSSSYDRQMRYVKASNYGTINNPVQPDAPINYFGHASRPSSMSSNVRVERSESSNVHLDKPVFGAPLDENKITSRTMGLLNSSERSRPDNMPEAEAIHNESGSKNKKKKNKNKRDEDKGQDINGNPVGHPLELGQTKNYSTSSTRSPSASYGTSAFPGSPAQLESYLPGADKMGGEKSDRFMKIKQKQSHRKKEQQVTTAGEFIKGNIGEKDIDELLVFLGDKPQQTNNKSQQSAKNSTNQQHKKLTATNSGSLNGPKNQANSPTKDTLNNGNNSPAPTGNGPSAALSPTTTTTTSSPKESKKNKKKAGAVTSAKTTNDNFQTDGNVQKEITTLDNGVESKDILPKVDANVIISNNAEKTDQSKSTSVTSQTHSVSTTEAKNKKTGKSNTNNTNKARTESTPQQQNNKTVNSTVAPHIANDIIFTDFGMTSLPNEEEFKPVPTKKKKRNQNSTQQGNSRINSQADSIHNLDQPLREPRGTSYYRPHNIRPGDFYDDHKHRTINHAATRKRAFTPPPTRTRHVEEKERSTGVVVNSDSSDFEMKQGRPLSPCNFPRLRRASTGNAELDVADSAGRESDAESSVSVPTGGDRALSSSGKSAASSSAGSSQQANLNFTRSYADSLRTKDAVGKTTDDMSATTNSSSSGTSGMGERRHSLGNINMLDMQSDKDAPAPVAFSVHRSQELAPTASVNAVKSSNAAQFSSLLKNNANEQPQKDVSSSSSNNSSLSTSKFSSTENIAAPTVVSTSETTSKAINNALGNASRTAKMLPPNPASDSDFPTLPLADPTRKSTTASVGSNASAVSTGAPPPVASTWGPINAKNSAIKSAANVHHSDNVAANATSATPSSSTTTTKSVTSSTVVSTPKPAHISVSQQPPLVKPPASIPMSNAVSKPAPRTQALSNSVTWPQITTPAIRPKAEIATAIVSKSSSLSGQSSQIVPATKQSSSGDSSSKQTAVKSSSPPPKVVTKNSVESSSVPVSKNVQTNNKSKSKNNVKTSSVVFLDKKFELNSDRDIGISFGFDDDLDSNIMTNTTNTSDVITTNVHPNASTTINPPSSQSTLNVNNTSSDSQPCSIDSKHVMVTTAISSPLPNGLVANSAVADNNTTHVQHAETSAPQPTPVPAVTVTATSPSHTVNQKPMTSSPVVTKQPEDICEAAQGVTTATTQLKSYKLPSRDDDPNYQTGSFDRRRAVQFLYEAWSRIEASMEKNAKSYYYKAD